MAKDIHPDLKEAAFALHMADLDYEENKGSSEFGQMFADRARAAQANYRVAKAELARKLGVAVEDL